MRQLFTLQHQRSTSTTGQFCQSLQVEAGPSKIRHLCHVLLIIIYQNISQQQSVSEQLHCSSWQLNALLLGSQCTWDNWVQLKNPYAILTDASTVRETSNFKLTQPASRSDWAAAATQQSQMRSRRVIKDFCLRQRRLYSKIITYFLFWQKTFQLLR